MSLLIYAQGVAPILPIPPRKDPIARAFGWSELARRATARADSVHATTGSTTWLGGDRYQEASELAFHVPVHPTTFATNLSGRPNQYDLWPRFPDLAQPGDNLVLVLDESAIRTRRSSAHAVFRTTNGAAVLVLRRGAGEIGTRRIWTLVGWRGGWPALASAN